MNCCARTYIAPEAIEKLLLLCVAFSGLARFTLCVAHTDGPYFPPANLRSLFEVSEPILTFLVSLVLYTATWAAERFMLRAESRYDAGCWGISIRSRLHKDDAGDEDFTVWTRGRKSTGQDWQKSLALSPLRDLFECTEMKKETMTAMTGGQGQRTRARRAHQEIRFWLSFKRQCFAWAQLHHWWLYQIEVTSTDRVWAWCKYKWNRLLAMVRSPLYLPFVSNIYSVLFCSPVFFPYLYLCHNSSSKITLLLVIALTWRI